MHETTGMEICLHSEAFLQGGRGEVNSPQFARSINVREWHQKEGLGI